MAGAASDGTEAQGFLPVGLPPATVTVSVSGGGYRATAFAAGALLALSDSAVGDRVVSVSSVSGGSVASALTIGSFDELDDASDPAGDRTRVIAELVCSKQIFTQSLLSWASVGFAVAVPLFLILELFPWQIARLGASAWVVIAVVIGTPVVVAITAVPDSLYAVQRVIEELTGHFVTASDASRGPSLADAASTENVRRIYCATDLSSGEHVYLAADRSVCVAAGKETLGFVRPNLLLADVVAASAGFPGFRPLVFSRNELGWGQEPAVSPKPRALVRRGLVGACGVLCLLVPVAMAILRLCGLLAGWWWFGILLATTFVAIVLARRCAAVLQRDEAVILADGGICDNLGAAFALMTRDARYPDLMETLGLIDDPDFAVFVIDASKRLSPLGVRQGKGLANLVPLRFSVLGRSAVQLVGNANATARRGVLLRMFEEGRAGGIISIGDVPLTEHDDVDWQRIAHGSISVPTTLDNLPQRTAFELVLQGYRLMEEVVRQYGMPRRSRTKQDLMALFEPDDAGTRASKGKQRAPYARLHTRVAYLSGLLATSGFLGLLVWVAIARYRAQ